MTSKSPIVIDDDEDGSEGNGSQSPSDSESPSKRERSPSPSSSLSSSLSPYIQPSGTVAEPVAHMFASYLRSLFGMMLGHAQPDEHPEERVALALMDEAPTVWLKRGLLYDLQYFGTFIRVRGVPAPINTCYACKRECSNLFTFQLGTGCDSYCAWNSDHEVAFLQNQWPSAHRSEQQVTYLPPARLSEGDIIAMGQRCASEARAYHKLFHFKAKLCASLVSMLQLYQIANVLEFDEWAKTLIGRQFCGAKAHKWDGIREWFDPATWKDKKFYQELQFSDD